LKLAVDDAISALTDLLAIVADRNLGSILENNVIDVAIS
jgi:hypothetical protein